MKFRHNSAGMDHAPHVLVYEMLITYTRELKVGLPGEIGHYSVDINLLFLYIILLFRIITVPLRFIIER